MRHAAVSHRVVFPDSAQHSTLLSAMEDTMLKKAALVITLLALVMVAAPAGDGPRAVNGQVLLGYSQTLAAPDVRCVGGEPADQTQPPYLLCSAGTTRIIGRSEVQVWMPASPSEQVAKFVNGPITFVVNCDMNAAYRGPCWGTFEWNVPDVGTWTGFWTAPIMDLVTYESRISMVGAGSGGPIDGMQIEVVGASAPGDWYVASTVRIK